MEAVFGEGSCKNSSSICSNLCVDEQGEEIVWSKCENLDDLLQSLDCIFTAHSHELGNLEDQPDIYSLDFPSLPNELQSSNSSAESNTDELSSIFDKWLKANRTRVTMNDLKKIKLKSSTIEAATKQLGGGRKGMAGVLKLILAWIEAYYLPRKHQKTENSCKGGTGHHSQGADQARAMAASVVLQPNSEVCVESPRSAATRAARRSRMARQRWSVRHARIHPSNPLPFAYL